MNNLLEEDNKKWNAFWSNIVPFIRIALIVLAVIFVGYMYMELIGEAVPYVELPFYIIVKLYRAIMWIGIMSRKVI